ncbi:MAG: thioredoxin family protein [Pseudomonadota bacterium]
MKRQKKTRATVKQRTNATPKPQNEDADVPNLGRRAALTKVRDYGIVVALVGGAGWYGVSRIWKTYAEYDIGQIGNGIPSIVQIHDPGCPLCRELQRETRKALARFNGGELQYLVADINTAKGRQLAATHGVGHVTLLLFDGEGRRRETLAGSSTADYLESAFRRHLAASSKPETS